MFPTLPDLTSLSTTLDDCRSAALCVDRADSGLFAKTPRRYRRNVCCLLRLGLLGRRAVSGAVGAGS